MRKQDESGLFRGGPRRGKTIVIVKALWVDIMAMFLIRDKGQFPITHSGSIATTICVMIGNFSRRWGP